MTKLLASVTSVAEAKIAMQAGVDVIDIKDPNSGALGAQSCSVISDIVTAVNHVTLTSATVGDIEPDAAILSQRIDEVAATGVDVVKVGLFASEATSNFLHCIAEAVAKGHRIVIVLFAEHAPLETTAKELQQLGVYGIMIDTYQKNGRTLLDHLTDKELYTFVQQVHSQQQIAGLAGSLSIDQVQSLLAIGADFLGFRGALCQQGERTTELDEQRLNKAMQAVHNGIDIGYGMTNSTEQTKEVLKDGAMA